MAIDCAPASRHESHLVQGLLDLVIPIEMPTRMIGDKGFDSDNLDQDLAENGIEMIAAHRKNRRPVNVTQDGGPLRRTARRWTVERGISCLQNFRRLYIRWEKSRVLSRGLLHFASTLLLLRRVPA